MKKRISNSKIAGILYEIAEMLDIIGENRFKSAAYRKVAKEIELLPVTLEEVYKKGGIEGIKGIPGVGEAIAEKLEQLITKGEIDYYNDLKARIPSEVGVLMKIPGMGPKKIKKLTEKLGIKTVEQLEKAAKAHKIRKLAGFGEESEKDILESIEIMRMSKGRISLKEAERVAGKIVSMLKKIKDVKNIMAAGSVRRKKATVGDIDILVSANKPEKIVETFANMKDVKKVLGKGETKVTVILKSGVQADVRVLKPESWGAGLLYFTGNKAYNIEMRRVAIKKGYKLSEYGLFDKQTGKMIAGRTESEVVKKLGLKLVSPEKREI